MDLSQLDDRPELTVPIGGQDYHFSELPIAKLADLQAYLPIRSRTRWTRSGRISPV